MEKTTLKNAKNKQNSSNINKENQNNEKFYYNEQEDKLIIDEILNDFERRKNERKQYEASWELNMNFVIGNQYSCINTSGEIEQTSKNFYWEEREVYNHIAPIVESRLAKLNKVRPTTSVRPSGNEPADLYCAKLSKAILSSVSNKLSLNEIISTATMWSEVTGTSFYKIIWDTSKGDTVATSKNKEIKNGDISISVCPPFEIYPDSSGSTDINMCESIIHARAYPTEKAKELWGVQVEGTDIDTLSFENILTKGAVSGNSNITKLTHSLKHNHILVLEKYVKPNNTFPNGRLTILVGNNLVFDDDLPFILDENNSRGYPFIKQVSTTQIGCFWGSSVIERCIPIQRGYNAIKNRKHEFMARLSAGVLAVEDGSVDIDNIEEEGLAPGKIIVYRNGSTPPRFIDGGSIPNEFNNEEDRLLNEFVTVSGVSELMRDSSVPSSISSGSALNLIIEQDETRLSVTAEHIRNCVRKIAQFIIRLYKQYASSTRLSKATNDGGDIELYYWNGSELTSDDVVLDTANELTETPTQRKNMLLDLYRNGLLNDENGRISNRNKAKLIEALGLGFWENTSDLTTVHIKKATKENLGIESITPLEIDDHDIHIDEHTKFVLSEEAKSVTSEHIKKLHSHILAHKSMKYAITQMEKENYKKLNLKE